MIGLGSLDGNGNGREGLTLSIEFPPDSNFSGAGKPEDWKDINNHNNGLNRNSNRSSNDGGRKSWNSSSNRLSAPGSRRNSDRPLSGGSATSGKSVSSNGTVNGSSSPIPPPLSPIRTSFLNNSPQPNTSSSPQPLSSSSSNRRLSRHGRQSSISTKRESMEIMGGLDLGSRASKRFSSNRTSGIQSASVLFGGEPDSGNQSNRKSVKDWDMRGIQDLSEDGEDRLTALEKLEGRSRSVSPIPPISETPRSPNPRESKRESLVQLPSFEDLHGENGMDQRKSLGLLEK